MFAFIMALILIMLGGVGFFVLYTKVGGVKALKHALIASYRMVKQPDTSLSKPQFALHLAKMLVLGMILIVGTLFTFYLKFMFSGRSSDIYNSEPLYGSSEHRTLHPLSYIDEDNY